VRVTELNSENVHDNSEKNLKCDSNCNCSRRARDHVNAAFEALIQATKFLTACVSKTSLARAKRRRSLRKSIRRSRRREERG
jgi:hypothetical protein